MPCQVTRPYLELLGQLLGDPAQQGTGGLLGTEQDQLHGPVSPQEEAFCQEPDPHHALQDPSRGADATTKMNPQKHVRGEEGSGRKGACGPAPVPDELLGCQQLAEPSVPQLPYL